jgi:hypothetical protein
MLDQAISPVNLGDTREAPAKWPTLAGDLDQFRIPSGAGLDGESRRSHMRRQLRGRAVLEKVKSAPGQRLGAYTLDISPLGLCLVSPLQLFPCERVTIDFMREEVGCLELRVRRCRRLQEGSYICGTTFVDGPFGPAQFISLLRKMC